VAEVENLLAAGGSFTALRLSHRARLPPAFAFLQTAGSEVPRLTSIAEIVAAVVKQDDR
jgi:hypothetical protein